MAAYHAAKGGVTVLTKNAAVGYGPQGVRVNAVHPGYINNPMVGSGDRNKNENEEPTHGPPTSEVPLGRFAEVSDVANAVLFLASEMSSYVNGIELLVDGGFHAK